MKWWQRIGMVFGKPGFGRSFWAGRGAVKPALRQCTPCTIRFLLPVPFADPKETEKLNERLVVALQYLALRVYQSPEVAMRNAEWRAYFRRRR